MRNWLSSKPSWACKDKGKPPPVGRGFFVGGGAAGLTGPGRILEEAVHSPYDATGATGGEIVILQNPDGSLLYAVSLGGARVAYADAATGFVVSGDLSSMNQVNAYVWKPSPL